MESSTLPGKRCVDVDRSAVALLLAAAALLSACDARPPVALPVVRRDRPAVPLGGPLELAIQFTVAADPAPPSEDFRVVLQFLDHAGAPIWSDEHDPPQPTSTWRPGHTIEYTRQLVVPMFPYVGEVQIAIGLHSIDGRDRLPLAGVDLGGRSYRVGRLTLEPQPVSGYVRYEEGWFRGESRDGRNWRWSTGRATVRFRHPRADSMLTMHLDGRPDLVGPQRVVLRVDGRTVHEIALEANDTTFVKRELSSADLGASELVEMQFLIEPTFVPAQHVASSTDSRELGARLFYLFVEPR